jgi:ATP-binding cassette, subfamily B (MDR/TAP), member 1
MCVLTVDGISEKVALSIHAIAMFFTAFIIAFIKQWKMTLVLTCIIPALGIPIIVTTTIMQKHEKKSLDHYAAGATLAEEVISTVRVAHAFGTQERLVDKYDSHLILAEKSGGVKSVVIAIQMFCMFFVIYGAEGLAFWYGATLIVNGTITNPGVVITVFFAVLIGSFSVAEIAPNLQAFTLALSACSKIYETIDRVPKIDIYSPDGERPKQVEGNLEFRNVNFIYPSRPEVQVLENVDLVVPHGKTTALVGASGSGKSTIVALTERWYDPLDGSVILDGRDLKDLNLKWLRSQISLVSQV